MKKYIAIILVLFQFSCITMISCWKQESEDEECDKLDIDINYDESFFDTFYIVGDEVIFKCYYTIESCEKEVSYIKISGNFTEDKNGGLIINDTLYAKDEETGDDIFEVLPGKNEFIVLYIGAHGDRAIKHNRLLPETQIYAA